MIEALKDWYKQDSEDIFYKQDSEDIFLWVDGTSCYRYESEEMNHMSDDYIVLYYNSEGYLKFIKELE